MLCVQVQDSVTEDQLKALEEEFMKATADDVPANGPA